MCENCAKSDLTKLDAVFKEFEGDGHALISILQKAQEIYGYLPTDVIYAVAEHVGVSPAKVMGVATFYTMYPKPLFEQWGSWPVTGMGMLVGGLTGVVACGVTGTFARGLPSLDPMSVFVLACAVLLGTCVSYGLFLHGISVIGPVAGNMLGAAEPVSATVLSALWLGTAFSWADWAGLVLMVATIVLIALQSRCLSDK